MEFNLKFNFGKGDKNTRASKNSKYEIYSEDMTEDSYIETDPNDEMGQNSSEFLLEGNPDAAEAQEEDQVAERKSQIIHLFFFLFIGLLATALAIAIDQLNVIVREGPTPAQMLAAQMIDLVYLPGGVSAFLVFFGLLMVIPLVYRGMKPSSYPLISRKYMGLFVVLNVVVIFLEAVNVFFRPMKFTSLTNMEMPVFFLTWGASWVRTFLPLAIPFGFSHFERSNNCNFIIITNFVVHFLTFFLYFVPDPTIISQTGSMGLGILIQDGINFITAGMLLYVAFSFQSRRVAGPDYRKTRAKRLYILAIVWQNLFLMIMLFIGYLSVLIKTIMDRRKLLIPANEKFFTDFTNNAKDMYNTWLYALWVWLIDVYPAVLMVMALTTLKTENDAQKKTSRFLRRFVLNMGAAIAFLLITAYAFDFAELQFNIGGSTADNAFLFENKIYFLLAKIPSRLLLVLLPVYFYNGNKLFRTWTLHYGVQSEAMNYPFETYHTKYIPIFATVLVLIHLLGWLLIVIVNQNILFFDTAYHLRYLLPFITGVVVSLAFLTIVVFFFLHLRFRETEFRFWHHTMLAIVLLGLLTHAIQSLAGQTEYYLFVFFSLVLVACQYFYMKHVECRPKTHFIFGPDGVKIIILKLEVPITDVSGDSFFDNSWDSGRSLIISFKSQVEVVGFFPKLFDGATRTFSIARVKRDKTTMTQEIELHIAARSSGFTMALLGVLQNKEKLTYTISRAVCGSFETIRFADFPILVAAGSGIAPLLGMLIKRLEEMRSEQVFTRPVLALFADSRNDLMTHVLKTLEDVCAPGSGLEHCSLIHRAMTADDSQNLPFPNDRPVKIYLLPGSRTDWGEVLIRTVDNINNPHHVKRVYFCGPPALKETVRQRIPHVDFVVEYN